MRTLKIAYVINSVEGGGAAMPVPAIARALGDAGAELQIFALTGRDRRALAPMLNSGLEVSVRPHGERDHLSALSWLNDAVAAYRPDLIWTSLTRATLLGQLVGIRRRIPVISWQHAAYLSPANKRLLRAMRNRSALWVADSSAVNLFTQRQLGVSERDIVTWPLFAADPNAPRASPWQADQRVRIGSLGRLHPVKGYDVLILALERLRKVEMIGGASFDVTIAGDGADRARLTELAERANLNNISFTGFCAEPRQFLASLHLYIQPSKSEGFCVAAHEAMQAGLPVIASDVGELSRSVVSGETGLLVPPGDAAALAKAILTCVSVPEELKEMGDAGRARLQSRFSDAEFRRGASQIVERLRSILAAIH